MRIVLVCALLATACSAGADDPRPTVVASFFPLAEVAREAGGGRVRVVDLTPPGAEPHDLELRTRDVSRLLDAKVAVVLGGGFQPGVERVARRRDLPTVTVLGEGARDPHVWLDPSELARVVARVGAALGSPRRAESFARRLRSLDAEVGRDLAGCRGRALVVAHAAFGPFALRYGLRQLPVAGLDPAEETDPRTLDRLVDLVRKERVTVFAERLLAPDVVRTLARESGARVAVLDPLESGRPGGYVPGIRANVRAIRAGLRC